MSRDGRMCQPGALLNGTKVSMNTIWVFFKVLPTYLVHSDPTATTDGHLAILKHWDTRQHVKAHLFKLLTILWIFFKVLTPYQGQSLPVALPKGHRTALNHRDQMSKIEIMKEAFLNQ